MELRSRSIALVGLVVLGLWVVPGSACADTTLTGTVKRLENGSPVAGAQVSASGVGAQGLASATTGAGGSYAIHVSGSAPFSVGVRADGFAGQSVRGVSAGVSQSFDLVPSTFTPLPINAALVGGGGNILPDATSGTFYALTAQAPELYRTEDYGGSWQAITLSYEDPDTGLATWNGPHTLAVSSVSGEVAVQDGNGNVFVSTDYGLTWRAVGGIPAPMATGTPSGLETSIFYWAHARAGATDVLVVARRISSGAWELWRADMSAANPTFVKQAGDPFGTGATIAFADSANGTFVGRVSASGELSFAPLTATGGVSFGPVEVSGLPVPTKLFRVGGAREASAPPDAVLVVGGPSDGVAQMVTKPGGAASFADPGSSMSEQTSLPAFDCQFANGPHGSIAPTSSGDAGAGNAGFCWLQKTGTGQLQVIGGSPEGGSFYGDLAFDARWGHGDYVVFAGSNQGPEKSAELLSNGRPSFPDQPASAGTDPSSGGHSLVGIHSPVVTDVAYGPAANELGVATMTSAYASSDGGRTLTDVVRVHLGSPAVAWWQGASGSWLAFGDCGPLTAFQNWSGQYLTSPNVADSTCASLGAPPGIPGYGIRALAAIPGTDSFFAGLSTQLGQPLTAHVYRARLAPGSPPSLTDQFQVDSQQGGATLYPPTALAYCPASSAAADMRDVLFVASAQYSISTSTGSLLRITAASTEHPSTSQIHSVHPPGQSGTPLTDVRADCATGTVYTGGGFGSPENLYKSTDGGHTFTGLAVPGVGDSGTLGDITAIGLNPADPNDVKVAAGLRGAIAQSSDGGQTWTIVNDPNVARPMKVSDIEYPPVGASHLLRGHAAAAAVDPLVASDNGIFRADLNPSAGLLAANGAAQGALSESVRMTALSSDQHPAVTSSGAAAVTVFRRRDGLWTSFTPGASWSLPAPIPGTTPGDDFPAVVAERSGSLQVAFVRTAGAKGIYVATRTASGAWSLKRLTNTAGDTLPALALAGSQPQLVFLRTHGRSRGVYYLSSRKGRWSGAVRVPGTSDAKATLGRPVLSMHGKRAYVVFARAGHKAGVYQVVRKGKRWSKPVRLTKSRGDADPALLINGKGVEWIVFRHTRGHAGLYSLRDARPSSLRRVPRTSSADATPALLLDGNNVILAFARPKGAAPGIYVDRATSRGRWLTSPRRWSKNAHDGFPAPRLGAHGLLTVVFQRG